MSSPLIIFLQHLAGANHSGRANDQECLAGEGCFFGLGSSVKFPFHCVLSPYSIFAAGCVLLPQRLAFPFSLVSSPDRPLDPAEGLSPALAVIKPAWVLSSNAYFLERWLTLFLCLLCFWQACGEQNN